MNGLGGGPRSEFFLGQCNQPLCAAKINCWQSNGRTARRARMHGNLLLSHAVLWQQQCYKSYAILPPHQTPPAYSHRLLKLPSPTLFVPAGQASIHTPPFKKAAFLHIVHALLPALHSWQSLTFGVHADGCTHRKLYFPVPALARPSGHTLMHSPLCKEAAFLHIVHALLPALHLWQSLTFGVHADGCSHRKLYVPVPALASPSGHASMHLPLCKKAAFLHIVHALLPALHSWQSSPFGVHADGCSHRKLYVPAPALARPSGHALMHSPFCKKAAFLHIVHALLSSLHSWQLFFFAMHAGATTPLSAVSCSQRLLKLPRPALFVPAGQASTHTPPFKNLAFLHTVHALLSPLQVWQLFALATHAGTAVVFVGGAASVAGADVSDTACGAQSSLSVPYGQLVGSSQTPLFR